MYKTESVLGLVGSILSIVSASFIGIFALFCRLIMRWTTITGSHMFRFFGPAFETGETIMGIAAAIMIIIALTILCASAILGFIGTSMLRKDNRRGGLLLVIAGAITLLPSYLGSGIFGTAIAVLFFISGIMSLTKKVSV